MQRKSYVKWIFVSLAAILIISAITFRIYQKWYSHFASIRNSKQYYISGIYQTGPQKDAVSSIKLAELMKLSVDSPTHILDFDESQAEKNLLAYPLFKKVNVKKWKPASIFVDYTIRDPYLIVEDYEDVVMDKDGVLFPYSQFFSTKRLPKCYLGANENFDLNEKKKLTLRCFQKAQSFFEGSAFKIESLDVSDAFSDSFAKREIIFKISQEFEEQIFPYYLRMSVVEIEKQLSNFLVLNKEFSKQQKLWLKLYPNVSPKEKVVDLRIEGMALIDN